MNKQTINAGEQLFDLRVAAGVMFCSIATVRRLVRSGELEHCRVGNGIRFSKAHIDNYLAKSKPRG